MVFLIHTVYSVFTFVSSRRQSNIWSGMYWQIVAENGWIWCTSADTEWVPSLSFSPWMCCVAKNNYASGIWHCRRALDLCVDANTLGPKYRLGSICFACLHVPQHLACQYFDWWIREIGPDRDWCHCRWRSKGKYPSFVLCLHFRHFSPPSPILHALYYKNFT